MRVALAVVVAVGCVAPNAAAAPPMFDLRERPDPRPPPEPAVRPPARVEPAPDVEAPPRDLPALAERLRSLRERRDNGYARLKVGLGFGGLAAFSLLLGAGSVVWATEIRDSCCGSLVSGFGGSLAMAFGVTELALAIPLYVTGLNKVRAADDALARLDGAAVARLDAAAGVGPPDAEEAATRLRMARHLTSWGAPLLFLGMASASAALYLGAKEGEPKGGWSVTLAMGGVALGAAGGTLLAVGLAGLSSGPQVSVAPLVGASRAGLALQGHF